MERRAMQTSTPNTSGLRVSVLHHVREMDEGEEDVKLIGIYSSASVAHRAIDELRSRPGFSEYPEGFHIDEYRVDETHWREGFITVPSDVGDHS